jgi:hypothetical protein
VCRSINKIEHSIASLQAELIRHCERITDESWCIMQPVPLLHEGTVSDRPIATLDSANKKLAISLRLRLHHDLLPDELKEANFPNELWPIKVRLGFEVDTLHESHLCKIFLSRHSLKSFLSNFQKISFFFANRFKTNYML